MRIAIAAAAGFFAGVVLVIALGGIRDKTVTVPSTDSRGGTVIGQTTVPLLVGQQLDVARRRAERARFDLVVDHGGGLLGVIVASNWQVVRQAPPAGAKLEQGSTIHIAIQRR